MVGCLLSLCTSILRGLKSYMIPLILSLGCARWFALFSAAAETGDAATVAAALHQPPFLRSNISLYGSEIPLVWNEREREWGEEPGKVWRRNKEETKNLWMESNLSFFLSAAEIWLGTEHECQTWCPGTESDRENEKGNNKQRSFVDIYWNHEMIRHAFTMLLPSLIFLMPAEWWFGNA